MPQKKKIFCTILFLAMLSTEPALFCEVPVLYYLSAHELSRHAVELERRSMQLSVEEGSNVE